MYSYLIFRLEHYEVQSDQTNCYLDRKLIAGRRGRIDEVSIRNQAQKENVCIINCLCHKKLIKELTARFE